MGTHPIFESDFDCLTDRSQDLTRNGTLQPVGRRRHEVLSFEDVRPTRSAQTNQDRDQGRGQEGGRGCYQNRQGRQERRLSQESGCASTQVLSDALDSQQDQAFGRQDLFATQANVARIPSQMIATSTKLDISGVAIPSKVNDAYFKRTKVAKKSEEGIFEQTQAKYSASEERKADQKAVDAAVLTAVNKEKYMKGYLKKDFGLSKGQYPHKMCW